MISSFCTYILLLAYVPRNWHSFHTLPSLITGGHFCGTPGSPDDDGECSVGYYCESGIDTATPSDSGVHKGTGGECPLGAYCPRGSPQPIPCAAGTTVQSNVSYIRSLLLNLFILTFPMLRLLSSIGQGRKVSGFLHSFVFAKLATGISVKAHFENVF